MPVAVRSMRGPRRRLDVAVAALARNASRIEDCADGAVLDLRADAYGLGADRIRALVRGAAPSLPVVVDGDVVASPGSVRAAARVLYGVDTSAEPVVRLTGEVVQVKRVPAGHGVSYGYTYRTRTETTLALVALGYADGVVRRASNLAPVVIRGRRAQVTGRVAMDQFVVDVGETSAAVGDDVVLVGVGEGEPRLADWEDATGWDALAFLAGLGRRVTRGTLP